MELDTSKIYYTWDRTGWCAIFNPIESGHFAHSYWRTNTSTMIVKGVDLLLGCSVAYLGDDFRHIREANMYEILKLEKSVKNNKIMPDVPITSYFFKNYFIGYKDESERFIVWQDWILPILDIIPDKILIDAKEIGGTPYFNEYITTIGELKKL